MKLFEPEELRLAADLAVFLDNNPLPSKWGDQEEVRATFFFEDEETGVVVRRDSGGGKYVVELR